MGKGSGGCERPGLNLHGEIIGSEDFTVTHREGLRLIVPNKMKFDWTLTERDYRSVILDENDQVVSIGFPKFGNYGEESFADHNARLQQALDSGETVRFTEKMDGSLCIRSVINGDVVFRTRGTFDGGDFGPVMRAAAAERYPVLLDPAFMPDHSLLFEFVSGSLDMQIVMRYEHDDLVFVGAREHNTSRLHQWEELQAIAQEHELNLVRTHELPTDLDELLAQVRAWNDSEGIVVRFDNDQIYSKIKTASYLILHRLRTQLSAKGVREICERENITDVEEFKQYIIAQGGDWEMVSDTETIVQCYLDTVDEAKMQLEVLDNTVRAWQSNSDISDPRERKKAFALGYAQSLVNPQRGIAFLLYEGKIEQAQATYQRALLDDAFEALGQREEAIVTVDET